MNPMDCPCKRTNCPRHGDCEACRAYHQGSRRSRPCERKREKAGAMMELRLGTERDLAGWMELVDKVKDAFPGLETRADLEAHRETVQEFMCRREAVCAVEDGRVVGVLLFSGEDNELCFLAVEPAFRRRHTAEKLVSYALQRMDPERAVTVTTYQEGDPAGAAARAFYKKLGFAEGALTEAFGSPVQEFVLEKPIGN